MSSRPPLEADLAAVLTEAEAACTRHDHHRGAELARAAIERAAAAGDEDSLARARSLLSQSCVVTGDFELAGRLARLALEHASVHGPGTVLAQACNTLSFVYDRADLAVLAFEHGMRALETARACGDRAGECLALNRLGVAVRGSDESAQAIGMLEESVRIARTLPAPDAAFVPLNNLASRWTAEADRLMELGRDPQAALRAAHDAAMQGKAIALASGVPLQRALISANLAGICRRLGDHATARTRFVEAIELAHAEGAKSHEATFRLALASLEVEAAPTIPACAALERELDAFPEAVHSELALRARRVLARALTALGEPARACMQWERLQALTQAAAGRRADAQWRLMQAREELAQARHHAERTRLEADLQRVRAEADAEVAREVSRQRDRLETEVAARTADLRQALVAAEAASRAKGAFLALVSHELRTPLNGVLGMVELARRSSTEPRQIGQLDKALGAGRGLAELVGQLLAFVAEAAPGLPEAAWVDWRELLFEVVHAAQPTATSKGIALVVEVADGVPATLRLDAHRLRRVLETLVGNAVKFSNRGPVTVAAQWSSAAPGDRADAADSTLVVSVIDHGPGIPPDVLPRLFRPFELGDLSNTRLHGGLGLGLALVDRWVREMGATIDVDSAPDHGSRFRVTLRSPSN